MRFTSRSFFKTWPWWLFAVSACVFHLREFFGQRPFTRDTHLLFVPAKEYFAREWAAGRLAEWWPWSGLGAPLLTQPQFSFFHPTTLFFGVLSFWKALLAQDVTATFLCMAGAYALSRSLKHAPSVAAFVAVAYGLSGYVCGLSEFTFSKLAAGMLPFYLASLRWASSRKGFAWVMPPVTLGLLLLSGDVQVGILASLIGVAWVTLLPNTFRKRTWGMALTSPLLAAALSAVQLIPSSAVASHTERGGQMVEEHTWHLQLHHLLGHVLPLHHGGWDYVPSTFMGLSVVGLAVGSLWALRRKHIWVVALTAVLAAILAAGDSWFLTTLFRRVVPWWSQFRYPIKSSLVMELCVAMLAGEGLRLLLWPGVRRRLGWTVGVVTVASLAFAAFKTPQLFSLVVVSALVALLCGILVVRHSRWFPWAAVVFAAELLGVKASWRATVEPEFYNEPPLAKVLRAEKVGLRGPAFDRVDDSQRPLEEWPWACALGAGGGDCSLNALWKLPCLSANQAGSSGRLLSLIGYNRNDFAFRMAGVFGVGYLVMRAPLNPRLQSLVVGTEPEMNYAVIRLPRFLPRAYGVHKARMVENAMSSKMSVWSENFRPGREVVLEGTPNAEWENRADVPAVEATFPVDRRDGDQVQLEAHLPWPGFVVLNEAYFPGWKAHVDGVEVPVFAANAAVRAVEVPQGTHQILFKYETPYLRIGAWVTAFAWLMVFAVGLGLRKWAKCQQKAMLS